MQVQSYLFFEGRCEEALDFYKRALGAQVIMLMRFKDSPEPANPEMCPPGSDDKVLHAAFRIGDTLVMGSDGKASGQPDFRGFALSLSAADAAAAKKMFDALADGGKVQMPLSQTFFSPSFGMLTDRFGVMWMIMVESTEKRA